MKCFYEGFCRLAFHISIVMAYAMISENGCKNQTQYFPMVPYCPSHVGTFADSTVWRQAPSKVLFRRLKNSLEKGGQEGIGPRKTRFRTRILTIVKKKSELKSWLFLLTELLSLSLEQHVTVEHILICWVHT